MPISEITDQFVEINPAETATPDSKSVRTYQQLQALQDKSSLALREFFDEHRKFVLK